VILNVLLRIDADHSVFHSILIGTVVKVKFLAWQLKLLLLVRYLNLLLFLGKFRRLGRQA